MKKLLLLILLLISYSIFATVDTRITQFSNTPNSPSAGQGTLVIDIEATSNAGNVLINAFQNAIQLDATFLAQNPSVSFSDQLLPAAGYTTTEEYRASDGRIRFVYTYDSGSKGQISGSGWTPVVRITIQYTMAAVNGSINWYSGIPNYNVLDENDQNITGSEGATLQNIPLPVELSSFSVNAVEGTKAKLQWETATEVNNFGFDVERSVKSENSDFDSWEKVAFVEGHGNSNSPKIYSFTDRNLLGGSKFVYRLKQIDIDGTYEFSEAVEVEILPSKYELLQNYPNPFNPSTAIKFSLPEDTKLAISIYNLLGEKVATVLNEELKAGFHQVEFNTNSAGYSLASGVYIYTLESKDFSQVKKMILMK